MFKSQLFKKQLFSLLFIAIFSCFFLSIITSNYTSKIVSDNILNNNIVTMESIRDNMDKDILKMLNVGNSIAFNTYINNFISNSDKDIKDQYDYLIKSRDLLRDMENQWGVNVYLHIAKNDYILTSNSYYEKSIYFNENVKYIGLENDVFDKDVREKKYFTILGLYDVIRDSNRSKKVVAILPIANSNGNTTATIVIELDNKLFDGEEGKLSSLFCNLMLVNDEDETMLRYNNDVELNYEDIKNIISKSGKNFNNTISMVKGKIGLHNYHFYQIESRYSKWKYVGVYEAKYLDDNLIRSAGYLLVIFIIISCLSLVIAYLIAKKMYAPVKNIVDKYRVVNSDISNEYDFIQDVLDVTNNENQYLKSNLEESNLILKNKMILSILNGEKLRENTYDLQKILGVEKIYDYFQVISIDSGSAEEDLEFLNKIPLFFNEYIISDDKINKFVNVFTVKKRKNVIVFLLNTDNKCENLEVIYEILENILLNASENFVTITIGVGRSYSGIDNINKSYIEGMFSLSKKGVYGFNRIINIEELKPDELKNKFILTEEEERKLINSVKRFEKEQVNEMLDHIITSIKSLDNEIECNNICNSLFIILIKIVTDLGIEEEEIFGEKYSIYKSLYNDDINEKIEQLIYYFEQVTSHVEKSTGDNYINIYKKILDFVEKEYRNEINLNEIAGRLFLSPSYVSWIFKKVSNTNFGDYISNFRVQKSKELLLNNEYSISEIANMVGISNVNSFIRIFKKFEGVTPGGFRGKK